MKEYMDFRDVVHATQSQMLHQFKGDNVFQGRVIEVQVLLQLTNHLHLLTGLQR
jgi:aconitase B